MRTTGRYSWYNENPLNRNVGDCTVRAISTALDQDWDTTYIGLCLEGYLLKDMPSSNEVWGSYLRSRGWSRFPIKYGMTVLEFADAYNKGTYILSLRSHVVAVINGEILDSWNSGNEIALYYWSRERK